MWREVTQSFYAISSFFLHLNNLPKLRSSRSFFIVTDSFMLFHRFTTSSGAAEESSGLNNEILSAAAVLVNFYAFFSRLNEKWKLSSAHFCLQSIVETKNLLTWSNMWGAFNRSLSITQREQVNKLNIFSFDIRMQFGEISVLSKRKRKVKSKDFNEWTERENPQKSQKLWLELLIDH